MVLRAENSRAKPDELPEGGNVIEPGAPQAVDYRRHYWLTPGGVESSALPYFAGAGFTAGLANTTSISTSMPGEARPATWTVDRDGRFGWSGVPKYCV